MSAAFQVGQWSLVWILVPSVIRTSLGRDIAWNFRILSLSIIFSVLINSSISFFLLRLRQIKYLVNDVPKMMILYSSLNPVSSWRCGLWSSHGSTYSLQVLGQSCFFRPVLSRRQTYIYVYLRLLIRLSYTIVSVALLYLQLSLSMTTISYKTIAT